MLRVQLHEPCRSFSLVARSCGRQKRSSSKFFGHASSEHRDTPRQVSSEGEPSTYSQYSLEFATCTLYFTNIFFFAERQTESAFQ